MSNLKADGVIEALTKDGKGFLIDGKWYRCFTPAMLKAGKGDFVSFTYKETESNGRVFNNVSGVVSGNGRASSPTTPSGTVSPSGGQATFQRDPLVLPVLLARERAIIRQSSLAQAVNYCNKDPDGFTVAAVIEIAREFEAYASGDTDIESAKRALESEDMEGADVD